MAMLLQPSRLRLTEAIYFGKPPGGGSSNIQAGNGIKNTPNPIIGVGNVALGTLTSDHDFTNFNLFSRNATNWFNVLEYGADNTGAADSSVAIQAAITAAAAAHGNVYCPHGTYKIGTALVVPNFITISGDGSGTIFTPAGNNYIFDLRPAVRSSIRDIAVLKFVGAQASGGAFDFSNCLGLTWLANIYVGSNLFTVLNIVPAAAPLGGIYIDRMTVDAVSGCNTFLALGGTAFNVAEVHLSRIYATAAPGGMQNWIVSNGHTDSLDLSDVTFYQGVNGITIQDIGVGTNSNYTWRRVIVDTMSGTGLSLDAVTLFHGVEVVVNTCGAVGAAALVINAGVSQGDIRSGQILNAVGSGASIANGVDAFLMDGMQFVNCNTSNTAARYGVDVAANASGWAIKSCNFINSGGTGHQKYGVHISAGTSNHYVIGPNEYTGMETGALQNFATGTDAFVWDGGNYGVGGVAAPKRPIHTAGPIRLTNAQPIIWENTIGNEVGSFIYANAANQLVVQAPGYSNAITMGTTTAFSGAPTNWVGMAAPAVSLANTANIYFDSATNKLRASLNGSAYVDVIGSGGVTGSGAAGRLTYWTAATTLTDEPNITLGGTYTLDVNGDINLNNSSDAIRVAGSVVFQAEAATGNLSVGGGNGAHSILDTAVGAGALNNSTGGGPGSNTAVGAHAAFGLTTAQKSVAVGAGALGGTTTGDENVAVGFEAGLSNTTGTNNLCVGPEADVAAGNLSNAVAIGYQAQVASNDSMVLGNGSMNVGIRTSTPVLPLDVNGAIGTRHHDETMVNGANQNFALTLTSWVRVIGPSAPFSIGGLANGVDGRILLIRNTTAFQMTINHLDAGSLAVNQISTPTGGNINCSRAVLAYEDASDLWVVMSYV